MKKLLFLPLFVTSLLFAQNEYNSLFQQEFFFGNLPYAKTEAMGGADAAVGGTINSIFWNPAGLGLIENQEVSFSTSAPFYALRRSDYYFGGYGRRINDKLVVGLSVNQFAVGITSFTVDINNIDYPLEKARTTNWAASASYSPLKGLHIGANLNMITLKFFENAQEKPAFLIDLGALYKLEMSERSALQFGGSLTNAFGAQATFSSPDGNNVAMANYPVTMRAGAAYILNSKIAVPGAGEGDFDLTATVGYMNVLNNEYRTTIRAGVEGVFYKVFALRAGFFTQNTDNLNNPTVNKSKISDFTSGFGIIIPLEKLTDGSLPFDAHIDYTSQQQPTFTFSGQRLPNMRTFGLRLVWK